MQPVEQCEDCYGLGEFATQFFRDGSPSHYQVCIECLGTGMRQPYVKPEPPLPEKECPF